ncbi:MAG: sulfatase-like hydrolase/transferase, partial [Deltaproteobacteria bacterium]|nr:sulfatase-like hydrolase/transferase [Deltaproteobacteria bacterium]
TVRADYIGSYGATRAHTPNFDTVAAEGVRFDVAISPTPLTLPSHASLMTALDPPAHGVRHNGIHRLSGEIPTLAEHLRAAGFATAAFVGALVLDARFGLDRGFNTYDDTMSDRMSGHVGYAERVLDARFGLDRGFNTYDDTMSDRMSGHVGYAERTADAVADAALAWLDRAPERFFLWLHFYDAHAGYDPPPGFASAFASRPYQGEIAFVDSQLGRVLTDIRRRWPVGGTLLVVTADHGESLGEHGEATHSYSIYDATQRIPLVMSGPGLPRGRVVAETVRLVDVAPTVIGLAGAAPLLEVEGRDLRPLIAGDEGDERIAYMETQATRLDYGWSPLLGVRTARFKYIRAPRPELYDLESDSGELRDIAGTNPEEVARLDGLLAKRLASGMVSRGDNRLSVGLSDSDRERLRSLGYVVPETDGSTVSDPHATVGPNPKDSIGLLRVLAEAQDDVDAGRLTAALARLEQSGNEGTAVRAMRASIAVATDDFVSAERDARAVLISQSDRPDVLLILGRALAGQGRLEEARAAIEASLLLDPASESGWEFLGRVSEGLGRTDAAREAFARSRQADAATP